MRSCGIFAGGSGARVPCLALWLSIGVAGAAQGQAPQSSPEPGNSSAESVEEIEITGRSTLISLRLEIDSAETRMFNLFNQFNDVRQFNISCRDIVITGRRLSPGRECVPTYMRWEEMDSTANALLFDINPPDPNNPSGPASTNGGAVSMNTRGAQQSEEALALRNQHKNQEFNVKFRALAAQHPELATAALDLQAKRQRLQELEANRRKGSVLGRFFSRSGGKDEE